MPWPAEAASPSKADKAALKRAIVACKAEAKGKKIKWLSRRKYVNNCVTEAMKDHPTMDVMTMLKDRPDLTDLASRAMARLLAGQAELRARRMRFLPIGSIDDPACYFDVARPRKSVSALRSSADPTRCSGILVPGV
jgi:hypothetical protein